MKDTILKFLDEKIEEGKILKAHASGKQIDLIHGAIEAFEDTKEFIELLTEEIEE